MEQIFGFQFSKEVYVRPCKVQANKDGEVTHFVIQIPQALALMAVFHCCVFRTHVHAHKTLNRSIFKTFYK
jgi:hypothetical protein